MHMQIASTFIIIQGTTTEFTNDAILEAIKCDVYKILHAVIMPRLLKSTVGHIAFNRDIMSVRAYVRMSCS